MSQACKHCNQTKSLDSFPVRHWTTPKGETRSGWRKICYVCQRDIDNKRYNAPESRKRAWKADYDAMNAEQRAAYRKAYYEANRDKWLDPKTGWRFNERAKAYDAEYLADPVNLARKKVTDRIWRQANKPRLLVKTRKRQSHVARATPPWADESTIQAVYDEAAKRTRDSGVKHEVDHYYPLTSDQVCGLHVAENLRVITALANRQKANKMPD